MKVILSRKGFDSANGGVANPILPDGRLCPLPIPDARSERRYADMRFAHAGLPATHQQLGALVSDLTNGKIGANDRGHLDPDLDADHVVRAAGWRPAFGQAGAAQGHLHNQSIGEGDLFLFYGWFRQVELVNERLQYVVNAPDVHVIYGWLQVDSVCDPGCDAGKNIPTWLRDHPHCGSGFARRNAIYVARKRLTLPDVGGTIEGGGLFSTYHPNRQLTATARTLRSQWRLPGWFYPTAPAHALSYHGQMARWQRCDDHVLLQTVGRGQEFVLDCAHYPQCAGWLAELFADR